MFNRHNLVYMKKSGRKAALAYARECYPHIDKSRLEALILSDIPAIIKRQENAAEDELEIGFSSPEIIDGVRFRISSSIPSHSITETLTPFDVARRYEPLNEKMYAILKALKKSAAASGFHLGVYGSLSLEMVTGLPYLHSTSDMDIYIKAIAAEPDYNTFYAQVYLLEHQYGISVDCEVEYSDHYGIKLKELFSGQRTVLAKGFNGVMLIGISEVLGVMPFVAAK